MSIPASQIVQVNVRTLPPGGTDLEFNAMLLTLNNTVPTETILQFTGATDVGAYFGFESEEYKLATVYFAGYNNSFLKPRKLYMARRVESAAPAFLRGGKVLESVTELQGITDSGLTITLSNYKAELTAIDFSSILTYSDIAVILQTAINAVVDGGIAFTAATVSYSSIFGAFTITNGESGVSSQVAFAENDIALRLKLTEATGAIISYGSDALSEAAQMESIVAKNQNWVNMCLAYMPEEDEVLAFGEWFSTAEGGVGYVFLYADDSPTLLQPGSEATIAHAIKEANLGNISGCYGNTEYPIFLAGVAASIDWNRANAIVTAAFKSQQGLAATVTNGTDAGNLYSQGMNFMGDYATRNDQFVFNYAGQVFGEFKWLDLVWGAIWMKNVIQVACMNGLTLAARVPYNTRGYTLVRAWIQDPINRGLKNTVIDTGVVLSESQKAQINQEAGNIDIATEVEQTGYYLQVADPGAQARVNRESPQVGLWYTYGGSINRLDIPVTILT